MASSEDQILPDLILSDNTTCDLHMQGEKIIKKDGKAYMNITQAKIKFTPSKMFIQLDNLFNGDKQLSECFCLAFEIRVANAIFFTVMEKFDKKHFCISGTTMNRVLNENWKLVYDEVGPSLDIAYAQVFKQHTQSLFMHVALEDLFPNEL